MPSTEGFYNTNTRRHETRETKSDAEVAASVSKAKFQDPSNLKTKATGRGMKPGESVSDWRARIKKMDEGDAETAGQKKALSSMKSSY